MIYLKNWSDNMSYYKGDYSEVHNYKFIDESHFSGKMFLNVLWYENHSVL